MPLQLGGASTERPQLIVWSPEVPGEAREARARYKALRRCGFRLRDRGPGQITLDPPEKDPYLGVFRILSQNGDDRVVWDRRSPAEVKEAFRKFKDFIAKGYTAYATHADGKRGHRIDDFDPGLEEIILVPSTVPG